MVLKSVKHAEKCGSRLWTLLPQEQRMHAPAVQPVNQHIQSHCDTNSKIISILTVFSRWTIVFFHCLFWKSLWYRFMQARCRAYQQTNSVTALTKENTMHVCETQSNQIHWTAVCIPCYHVLCWLTQITNGPLIKKNISVSGRPLIQHICNSKCQECTVLNDITREFNASADILCCANVALVASSSLLVRLSSVLLDCPAALTSSSCLTPAVATQSQSGHGPCRANLHKRGLAQ